MKFPIMPRKVQKISPISQRVLELCSQYPTAKAFIEDCGITNYSLITDIRKGRIKTPGAEYLSQMVSGTGCSGTWLLTGKGEKFPEKKRVKLLEVHQNEIDLAKKIEMFFEGNKAGLSDDAEFSKQLLQLLSEHLQKGSGN